MQPNHLAKESSPYLKQHANNPVEWYPWGPEALDKARKENKPILLSIGYAACHWCHVMAHESFEDKETANLMNTLFINIKVDREERPDIDKIYQTAHSILAQRHGGWPLTIFLTPNDATPFYSGTYFPREARYQLPAFKEILKLMSKAYQNQSNNIQKQNAELTKILTRESITPSNIQLTIEPIQIALRSLSNNYDKVNGGFGGAPKFPHPSMLEFLLTEKLFMSIDTLRHMANSGIFDQLGGGFYRYTVDEQWRIPHFEKMLYDNGQLLFLYSLAAKQNSDELFAKVARETSLWAINEMQSPEGGYYSSINADSEGHEGKFYVWDNLEIERILTHAEYTLIKHYFGLDQEPNFEGKWHLYITQHLEIVALHLNISLSQAEELLASAKVKLLTVRNKRISPTYDTKILTSWNSLMIKGMLTAGDTLQEPLLVESAQRAIHFIRENLWSNKRLLASYHDSHAHLPAYLDDYAFLIDALITSLQQSWNTDHLLFAIELADALLTYFSDGKAGGFYFTANDHEKLLYRPKTMADEAIPSGNAIAARSLLILGHLLGEPRYIDAVEKTLYAAWPSLTRFPAEHCSLLLVLNDFIEPPKMIIIRGPANELKSWQAKSKTISQLVFSIPDSEKALPGLLDLKKPQTKACAYICQGLQCLPVIDTIEELTNSKKVT